MFFLYIGLTASCSHRGSKKVNSAKKRKFCGNSGKYKNFVEVGEFINFMELRGNMHHWLWDDGPLRQRRPGTKYKSCAPPRVSERAKYSIGLLNNLSEYDIIIILISS